MSYRRLFVYAFVLALLAVLIWIPSRSFWTNMTLTVGRNINMVSGDQLPWGDPYLQRQNEPSLAVSTRNPMHLFGGANDYRTVDMSAASEVLPGLEKTAAARDAWLGILMSFNGGESWSTGLLPGFPQDSSSSGLASPLKEFDAAADPVVRAGTNGLFYYSGIAFDRGNNAPGAVFVARFIDNNNKENGIPFKYIGTKIIDRGNAGQFLDKPWIAVDIPRSGAKTVPLTVPDTATQYIEAGSVYVGYSRFTGSAAVPKSDLYITRSADLGATWDKPVKISEGEHVNQGAVIAIDPRNGSVYVFWRRFKKDAQYDAIIFAKSTDGGKKYSKPAEVSMIQPFDQGTSGVSFRTNSYPTAVVDSAGVVYVGWAQRSATGVARVVIRTSSNGTSWNGPYTVDDNSDPGYPGYLGHQFMPTMTYAAGRLMIAWYDQRDDVSGSFGTYIDDSGGTRHSIDVYAKQAVGGLVPTFGPSRKVSRYLNVYNGTAMSQVQWNLPNLPMFKQGTAPFHGDYVDIAPAPFFVRGPSGSWTYNTDSANPPFFHVAWTDNRDVKAPANGNWANYTPPTSLQNSGYESNIGCATGQTGMRNQNVYTSVLSPGLIIGTPGNIKPLSSSFYRTFVVYVQNTTSATKQVKLTIHPSSNITDASFVQNRDVDQLLVYVAPFSSISRTIYAKSADAKASLNVSMEEIGGDGLTGNVALNSDPTNPAILDPDNNVGNPNIVNQEVHNPNIVNPNIVNPNIVNPNIVNPNIVNPNIVNPNIVNPNIVNPNIVNPNIVNPNIVNPNIVNPHIVNPNIVNSSLTDNIWVVKNTGNTTSAYSFQTFLQGFDQSQYLDFGFQLLVYKVFTVPAAPNCDLKLEHHDELIANIVDPIIGDPSSQNPDVTNGNVQNVTFWLAPGEEAQISLRVFDPNKTDSVTFDPDLVDAVVVSQPVNTTAEQSGNFNPPKATMPLALRTSGTLPNGQAGSAYSAILIATGGLLPRTWTVISGALPDGLSINSASGVISGTPTTVENYSFTVQVADATVPIPNSATQSLSLHVDPKTIQITSPNGAESWLVGSTHNITWTSSLGVGNISIEYSRDNGAHWNPIAAPVPNTGSYAWTVPSPVSASCSVKVREASDPTVFDVSDAVFSIAAMYTLTVSRGVWDNPTCGNGQVKVNGDLKDLPYSGSFLSGTTINLEAIPDSKSRFENWSGDIGGMNSVISFVMNGTKSVNANFFINGKLTLTTLGTGGGKVQIGGSQYSLPYTVTYPGGTNVSLDAVPDLGSAFMGWSGDLTGIELHKTILMNGPKNVQLTFDTTNYMLTVTKGGLGNGQLKVNNVLQSWGYSQSFPAGTTVNLEALPAAGSTFGNWSGDLGGFNPSMSVVMDRAKNVTANFNIMVISPTKLAFHQQPGNAYVNSVISPPVTVHILDINNTLVTTATNMVTLAIGANPGGGTLHGTVSKAAVGGIATFNDISIGPTKSGYTLTASSGILTPAVSDSFDILMPPAFESDQVNEVETGTTSGMANGQTGSLFQTLKPEHPKLSAVRLRFRAGGPFPGMNSTINLRFGSCAGDVLATATTYVSDKASNETFTVYYYFPTPLTVTVGQTYVIEWLATDVAIMGWYRSTTDTYGNGEARGATGVPFIPSCDFIFRTYTQPLIINPSPEINIKQGPIGIPNGGTYDFGTRAIDSHTDVAFTIENTADLSLTLTGNPLITISGTNADQFQITALPSTPIIAGASTTFTIQFSPTSLGLKTARISIPNSDSDENPYEIPLSGNCTTGLIFSTFDQDTVGQLPPLTGPPTHPTEIIQIKDGPGGPPVDGTVKVRSVANGLTTQPVEINGQAIPGYYLGSVNYDLGTTISSGTVILEATMAVNTVLGPSDYGFFLQTTSEDSAVGPRLWIYGGTIKGGNGGNVLIGTYQANVPFRVRASINLDTQRWSAVIDNELNGFADDDVISNLTFENTNTVNVRKVWTCSCPYNIHQPFSCAYDDIYVGYLHSGGGQASPVENLFRFDELSENNESRYGPMLPMDLDILSQQKLPHLPVPDIGLNRRNNWNVGLGSPVQKNGKGA